MTRVTRTPLTSDEAKALKRLEELANEWPPSLTIYVSGSDSLALSVIFTPDPGSRAEDDLSFAEVVARFRILSASSA
jgi:hypothetical protein